MTLLAPVWILALGLAAISPWCVRALADRFELRVRRRTEALIARARGTRDAHTDERSESEDQAPGREERGALEPVEPRSTETSA